MKLDITFDEKTMFTPVYIKIGALLLSEGVFRQLGIIRYHGSGCGTSGQEKEGTGRLVPPGRMPFVVRQEVARQLKNMQEEGVISPSSSHWAGWISSLLCRLPQPECSDKAGLLPTTKS